MRYRFRVMCKVESAELSGIVEVDETYIGGKERNNTEGTARVSKQVAIASKKSAFKSRV